MAKQTFITVLCLLAVVSLGLTGCLTTTQKGAAIGTGVGAGAGALIGGKKGALIGAGIGAVGGVLVGNQQEKKSKQAERVTIERNLEIEKPQSEKLQSATPDLEIEKPQSATTDAEVHYEIEEN